MNMNGWFQITFYIFTLLVLVKPLGNYMARIYQGESTFLTPILSPLERQRLPGCGKGAVFGEQAGF